MNRLMNRVMSAVMALVLAGAIAYAGEKAEKIEIPADVTISGVVVKKGTYSYTFDESSGKLTLLKGKRVVAEAKGRLEARKSRVAGTELIVVRQENASVLKGLSLPGQDKAIMMDDQVQTAKPQ